MTKVSVIIPTYNCEKYLPETIESVLNQTYQDFEIIIADDGSTDNTKSIVSDYTNKFTGKILYCYQDNNGPAAARNKGIKKAKGEYIAFLDSDDLWLTNRLEEGVKALDSNPDIGLAHANIAFISEDKTLIDIPRRKKKLLSGDIFINLFLRKAHISCPTVIIKKQCVEKVGLFDENPQCVGVEDRDLWLRIAKEYKILYSDKVLAYYRMRGNSLSKNYKRMLQNRVYVVGKFCTDGKHILLRNQALANIYRELGDDFLLTHRFCESRIYYLKSLLHWPLSPWPWINLVKSLCKINI